MPRAAMILVSSLLALAVSACGAASSNSAKDFNGDEAQVADVVELFEKAGSRGEAEKICTEILAETLRDSIASSGENCTEEVERAIDDADSFTLTVKSVSVSGSRATAKVEGSEKDEPVPRTFELVKESGRWRVSSFGSG